MNKCDLTLCDTFAFPGPPVFSVFLPHIHFAFCSPLTFLNVKNHVKGSTRRAREIVGERRAKQLCACFGVVLVFLFNVALLKGALRFHFARHQNRPASPWQEADAPRCWQGVLCPVKVVRKLYHGAVHHGPVGAHPIPATRPVCLQLEVGSSPKALQHSRSKSWPR